ncbi:MAG TPA: hypothetical protein VEK57_07630, partial [Thermoanaerobaculia bacterium]|nr:hypothetical protein [Thermoanaerobaculia bacterium]
LMAVVINVEGGSCAPEGGRYHGSRWFVMSLMAVVIKVAAVRVRLKAVVINVEGGSCAPEGGRYRG